jgi:uncharacterized membrane protein YfcA
MLQYMLENTIPLLLIIGFFGGIISGLLGVGGGIIVVPALYFLLKHKGYDPALVMHMSVATSLCVMIVTSIFATRTHYKRHSVSWPIFRILAPYLILGVVIGSFTAQYYSATSLVSLFAVFALISAIRLGLFPQDPKHKGEHFKKKPFKKKKIKFLLVIIGFLSSLMGIGGGTFTVPLIVLMGISVHLAIGTSAAFGLIISFFGTLGFAYSGYPYLGLSWPNFGYVQLDIALWLALTSFLGASIGANLTHRLDHILLQRIFAFFLIIIALKMGYDLFV